MSAREGVTELDEQEDSHVPEEASTKLSEEKKEEETRSVSKSVSFDPSDSVHVIPSSDSEEAKISRITLPNGDIYEGKTLLFGVFDMRS